MLQGRGLVLQGRGGGGSAPMEGVVLQGRGGGGSAPMEGGRG